MKVILALNLTALVFQCFIYRAVSDLSENKETTELSIWLNISQYLVVGVAVVSVLFSGWKCVSQKSLHRRGWVLTLLVAALAGASVYAMLLHYDAMIDLQHYSAKMRNSNAVKTW